MKGLTLHKTKDWQEDYGNCIFFHFPSFEEPPQVYCSSPAEVGFDEEYWNYFVKDIDMNFIFEQAIEYEKE